jgi:hypothetical protein
MIKPTRVSHPIYSLLPTEVDGFDPLAELALDVRSSWNHAADEVWLQLDPVLWELTHNPWVVLQTVSRDRLEQVLADPAFRKKVDAFVQSKDLAAAAPAWFQQNHPQAPLTCVAYFSMEFMLSEALPIYSGGLGNVAGDQLKAASDLGEQVVRWQQVLEQKWGTLHFGEVQVATDEEQHVFDVEVYLNDLDSNAVRVEIYADGVNGGAAVRQEMKRTRKPASASGGYVYTAAVSAARLPMDYTARVIPHCLGVAIPLEEARILWQR